MKLVFSHIPKTAGTSFRVWLADAIGREKIFWHGEDGLIDEQTPEDLKAYRAIGGHFHIHNKVIRELEGSVGRSNILYATSVRDPIRQLLSHFNYVSMRPENPAYSGKTIEEALRPGTVFFNIQKNIQCSYLSKERSFSGFLRWKQERQVEWAATEDIDLLCTRIAGAMRFKFTNAPHVNVAPQSYDHLTESALATDYVQKYCSEDQELYLASKEN